jgi:hypothetical protein
MMNTSGDDGMAEDRRDYFAAFAIGAIVGIGATLLLGHNKPSRARRVLYELEPALKQARRKVNRGMKQTRRSLRKFR